MCRETRGDVHQIKRKRGGGGGEVIFAVNQSKQKGVSLGDELGGIKANSIWCGLLQSPQEVELEKWLAVKVREIVREIVSSSSDLDFLL